MVDLRRHDLAGLGASFPRAATEPLTGLKPFAAHPAVEAFRSQDLVAALSRRIVLSGGLRGDSEWRVPNTDPLSATQIYPNRTTWYVVARGRIDLTPGCYLEFAGAYVPSGETNRAATAGEIAAGSLAYRPDGAQGRVRVTITWYRRDTSDETTTHEIDLPASTLEYGAEDTTAAGLWRTLRDFGPVPMAPTSLDDVTELAAWSLATTADITVEVQGSPRLVDWTISETPVAIALDLDDATSDDYAVSHLYGADPIAPVPVPRYSFARWAQRGLQTARAQATILGPALLHWSAYSETAATSTATIVARTTSNDGTTFESLLNSSHTGTGPAAYSATLPGWSVSVGGYARRWSMCNSFVLRDRIAVIPVIVSAYGRGITAGTSTVRVQTALHSYVDLTLPVGGSAAWHHAYGYLEVGITPEQPQIAQVFLNHLGSSGSLSVEAISVSQDLQQVA